MCAAVFRRSALLAIVLSLAEVAAGQEYLWQGYARGPQHAALSTIASQPLTATRWTATVDLDPQCSRGELLIHYGSPAITAGNSMLVPVKRTARRGVEGQ